MAALLDAIIADRSALGRRARRSLRLADDGADAAFVEEALAHKADGLDVAEALSAAGWSTCSPRARPARAVVPARRRWSRGSRRETRPAAAVDAVAAGYGARGRAVAPRGRPGPRRDGGSARRSAHLVDADSTTRRRRSRSQPLRALADGRPPRAAAALGARLERDSTSTARTSRSRASYRRLARMPDPGGGDALDAARGAARRSSSAASSPRSSSSRARRSRCRATGRWRAMSDQPVARSSRPSPRRARPPSSTRRAPALRGGDRRARRPRSARDRDGPVRAQPPPGPPLLGSDVLTERQPRHRPRSSRPWRPAGSRALTFLPGFAAHGRDRPDRGAQPAARRPPRRRGGARDRAASQRSPSRPRGRGRRSRARSASGSVQRDRAMYQPARRRRCATSRRRSQRRRLRGPRAPPEGSVGNMSRAPHREPGRGPRPGDRSAPRRGRACSTRST